MKNYLLAVRASSILLAGTIFLTGCASTTVIQSYPSGAKIYLDGEPVGTTPYTYEDTKIVGSTTLVKLEKEGYEPFSTSFSRNEEVDVGAIIGGLFVWVPFLWTMKYKPFRTYEMQPATGGAQTTTTQNKQAKSKAESLQELNQLLDKKLISQEEYNAGRKRILEEK